MKLIQDPKTGDLVPAREYRARVRRPAIHTRFKPHVTYQLHPNAAKELGLKRTGSGGTFIPSERKLNEMLSRERRLGKDVGWKQH